MIRPNRLVTLVRRFAPQLVRVRGRLLASVGVGVVTVAAALAVPWPLKWLIDDILPGHGLPEPFRGLGQGLPVLALVAVAAGFSLAASTLYACAGAAQRLLDAGTLERLTLAVRLRMVDHLGRLSPDLAQAHRSGDVVTRLVNDSGIFVRIFTRTGPNLLRHGATAVLTLAVMFWLALPLGLLGCVVLPLLALLARSRAPRLADASRTKRDLEGDLAGIAQEWVKSLPSLQASGHLPDASRRFERAARVALSAGVEESRASASLERSLQLAQGGVVAVVLLAGAALVIGGQATLGSLTLFAAYIGQLLKPIEKINELAGSLSRGLAAGERVVALLDREVRVTATAGARELPPGPLAVELDDVSFAYPGADGPCVLRHVSMTVAPGQLTVLCGPSGAGKSTVLSLIARLFDPGAGEIRIGGMPLREVAIPSLRESVVLLSQRGHVFAGSLRDGLLAGRIEVDEAAVWRALERVELADFARSLPAGLDSHIGEDGVNLSGGQLRRLGLARLLLGSARVVLLDEPTAGVDARSERVVRDTLAKLAQERTILVVSHRSGLLAAADAAFVLGPDGIRRVRAPARTRRERVR